ncbi:translation initiation factor IF-2 [Candidatus Micrarchaeota archaeon]|nr:translation initiation factor IF-2 [Candidatus Micrarchaeota archaeon]
MHIRSPIVVMLGHVDHGKTTLLDTIRGTAVAAKEAGKITQMIGASYIRKEDITHMSAASGGRMKFDLKIPGLLFIDTPGHEAFTNLRDRGGSIADIAILVVDVMQGFQPQTLESVRILKQYKTPFVIAANKIDLINGWTDYPAASFIESYSKQPQFVKERLDDHIYGLMGKISEHGFDSERFDRIGDFSKQIAIIPVSAKTKEGLGELLMLIAGLSQKFLGEELEIDEMGRGRGSILEVKDEKGLGTTVDVILYDGLFRKNDEIIFLTQNGAKKTKIRALLEPNASGKEKYNYVDELVAAAGVKIVAPDLEGALPGSPVDAVTDFEENRAEIEKQFRNIIFEKKDELGVVLRADSLGSVEALVRLFEEAEVRIKSASTGKITRKEILMAEAVSADDRYYGAVLGFNVDVTEDARVEADAKKIPVIWSDIIYRLLENYNEWVKDTKEKEKSKAFKKMTWPGKIKLLAGCCFRVSKPAIFGVEVLGGKIRKGCRLMNAKGEVVGEVREMQREKEKVEEAERGTQLAISCDGIYYGKDVCEGNILYTYITKAEITQFESQPGLLSDEERLVFEEIKKLIVSSPFD